MSCPDCRSHSVRRRKRAGFSLYLVSLLGRWPYRCEDCGTNFLLPKRYLRQKSTSRPNSKDPSGDFGRPTLTAPIGGVAAGDEAKRKRTA